MSLTLALTADLHWGHRRGVEANADLAAFVRAHPPDVFVLGGDVGSGDNFTECLRQFESLPGRKCLVPGNHDLWVPRETGDDSLHRYHEELPALAAAHGFHYLDHEPLYIPEEDLAIVGSINWYDYTWSLDQLRRLYPGEEMRLQSKRFTRGRHNDANFVRWSLDDTRFTAEVVTVFERHLREALDRVGRVIVVTHHPPFHGLGFPHEAPPQELDALLWDAFSGNQALEEVLARHKDRIALAFCGHTHRAREGTLGSLRGINIGGDYHFKRLLSVAWPACALASHEFY
jgi:predicted phosphohydrolase